VLKADLRATQLRVDAATARLRELSGTLAQARSVVNALAVAAYQVGPTFTVSGILSATSPHDAVARITLLDATSRARQAKVLALTRLDAAWQRDHDILVALAQEQTSGLRRIADLRTTVKRDIATLERQRARNQARSQDLRNVQPPAVSGAAGKAIRYAYSKLGKRYRFAAAGPNEFDCSGLTMASWRAAGVALPHSAARQYHSVAHIGRASLAPGDLVFYYGDIHHVALYVGNHTIIHAPNVGETVRLESLDYAPIHGYGRPG
jgi:cell wall-associated NlpC family hydrolase